MCECCKGSRTGLTWSHRVARYRWFLLFKISVRETLFLSQAKVVKPILATAIGMVILTIFIVIIMLVVRAMENMPLMFIIMGN